MSNFKIYLEAEMSPDDEKQIYKLKRRIAWLKTTGDDSGVKQDVRETQYEIKKIQNKYKSDEDRAAEKERAEAASLRGYKQRIAAMKEKGKSAAETYTSLSDEEKVIEAIVKINRDRFLLKKSEKKAMIDDIMKAFNITQRPYTFKSKLSLKEKAALNQVPTGTLTRLMPEKLVEIAKKYKKSSGYFV